MLFGFLQTDIKKGFSKNWENTFKSPQIKPLLIIMSILFFTNVLKICIFQKRNVINVIQIIASSQKNDQTEN